MVKDENIIATNMSVLVATSHTDIMLKGCVPESKRSCYPVMNLLLLFQAQSPPPITAGPRPWMRRGVPLPSPQSNLTMKTLTYQLQVHGQTGTQRVRTAPQPPFLVKVRDKTCKRKPS